MNTEIFSIKRRRQRPVAWLFLAVLGAVGTLTAGERLQSLREASAWQTLQADVKLEYFTDGRTTTQDSWRLYSDGQGRVALMSADGNDGQWALAGRYVMKVGGIKMIDHPITSGSPSLALLQLLTLNQNRADASSVDKDQGDQLWLRIAPAAGGAILKCTVDGNGRVTAAKVDDSLVSDFQYSTVGNTRVLSAFTVRTEAATLPDRVTGVRPRDSGYRVKLSFIAVDASLPAGVFEP